MSKLVVCLIAACLAVLPALAQVSDPKDLQFNVSVKGGQTTFRIGEVVPLELSFSSSVEKKYQVDMARYDRSGRLNIESFAVEPSSSWSDPLKRYFNAFSGFMGGGLRGINTLSPKPDLIELQLNEWVRTVLLPRNGS